MTRAAPDLAVEVLSRSTEARDRGRKMQLLARFHSLGGSTYELAGAFGEADEVRSPTLPELTFPAARVFAA